MRNYLFLSLIFSLLFTVSLSAQSNCLTGPAAKNRKHLKSSSTTSTIVVKQHRPHTGPQAKNRKLWKDSCTVEAVALQGRKQLKGPKAKNALHRRKMVEAVVKN
ncbi:hypothetical protein [Flavilitoribacter nigricans]|uniref:Secreted protein n=1 Tax=Flavilitoribacter nigricans (strain ATCC 23147 / DSM 23189 / NBRC 102662 / NCIMB 1420 / SS-2) TaxID=1122177 RepID=A0A2D0MZD1_FLAN2|nr:hypothetical protein [Flavilitoribacter nigricans]PHN01605.1 hypothetical protein CRP01_36510 [Flavilitoribacter nigricans DSM 23189 = NBRC 102662]